MSFRLARASTGIVKPALMEREDGRAKMGRQTVRRNTRSKPYTGLLYLCRNGCLVAEDAYAL